MEKARTDKILSNDEIGAMITAIGCGIGEEFDIDKARYHKIIIMTDADVDGAHIRTLLLTFFYREMESLITQGYVYIANPPLYQLKKGKKEYYAYSEEEREEYIDRFSNGKNGKEGAGVQVQRYKGLGEMNPTQLWKTTMDPDTRTIHQVTVENPVTADETFSDLMGDEVQPRKEFITKHAKYVKNLDV